MTLSPSSKAAKQVLKMFNERMQDIAEEQGEEMNNELPIELVKDLEDINLDITSEILAKQISELSDSLKSEEMKVIESQQKEITQLQAKLDEANTVVTNCPEINLSNYDSVGVENLNNALIEIYQILNPPVEEKE